MIKKVLRNVKQRVILDSGESEIAKHHTNLENSIAIINT
jgi:hypothetical protein